MAITNQPLEGESLVDKLEGEPFFSIPFKRVLSVAAVALILGGVVYANIHSKDADKQANTRRTNSAKVTNRAFVRAVPAAAAALPDAVEAEEVVEQETPPAPNVEIREVVKYIPRPAPAIPKIHNGRSKTVQVAAASTTSGNGPNSAPQSTQPANTGAQQVNGRAASGGVSSDGVRRSYASELQNTDRLLIQGVDIPCTLDGAINTQLAGDVSCTVNDDIWSADNSRVLVAKGSKANGKYQIETTSSAVTRIGAIWGRIRTTDNMVANLDSGTTDRLGASGIPANSVDYHFWEKYGTAFGVSLVQGALKNIGSRDTNAEVVVNSATGVSSDIVSQILAASINIPTTRGVLPGETIIIHLQGDIEFKPLS